MLTRKQIEAWCLGCDKCEGVRIRNGTLYIISENKIKFIGYREIKLSEEVNMFKFKHLQKLNNIDELRNHLTEYYPFLK